MLQNVIVILILLSAVVYAFRGLFRSVKSKSSSKCDGCSGCELKNAVRKSTKVGC